VTRIHRPAERNRGRPSLGQGKNKAGGVLEDTRLSAAFRFTLRIKVALFHCVVTPVSAIVRKLEMVFVSNESAYLRCLCYSRAVRSDCVCIALKHSSKKVRIRMSCSKRCKANYLWEPQRVVCYFYSARAILDPALRRSEASLQCFYAAMLRMRQG
jgi:hypothetical protein